jgi:L-2-hydroxyglutarate oxidase LhgO
MTISLPITIIGGGVIGLAIARELSAISDGVYLLEKNIRLGDEASTRNAEVIHASIFCENNTLEEKLCLSGKKMLYQFCNDFNVPYSKCGKLIVATDSEDENMLESMIKEKSNKMNLIELNQAQIKSINPRLKSKSALYLPSSGVINSADYLKKLSAIAKSNHAQILPENEVIDVIANKNDFTLKVKCRGHIDYINTDFIINAAGENAGFISEKINPEFKYELELLEGKFYNYQSTNKDEVNMNIYPAPKNYTDPNINVKNLGIHLTPNVSYDGFSRDVKLGPAIGFVSDESKNKELFSKDFFYDEVSKYYSLNRNQLYEGFSGKLVTDKSFAEGFIIRKNPKHDNCIELINIGSPGLTASLAIATMVRDMYLE